MEHHTQQGFMTWQIEYYPLAGMLASCGKRGKADIRTSLLQESVVTVILAKKRHARTALSCGLPVIILVGVYPQARRAGLPPVQVFFYDLTNDMHKSDAA
jgi:hypothetical protein